MKKLEYYESGALQSIHTKGGPVMTPVSDAMLDDLRVADKEQCASRVTQSQINMVIAELLALRAVADAAVYLGAGENYDKWLECRTALRAAGRGSP